MWIPADADEIDASAKRGDLEETPSFDAKRELPSSPKKNVDVAIDIAAMSTDGGVLLYGVDEDEYKRPTIPKPMELAGAADRVGQIVSNSISEVPFIDVREFPTSEDPSIGYLVVVVPQSPRAPHQVTVGEDLRFYGRGAKGNRRLTEGDIARLYQRRQEWEQDRDALLVQAVEQAPFAPQDGLAYLHAFARPVAPDRAIWDHALTSLGGRDGLQRALADAAGGTGPSDGYAPNLKSGVYWRRNGADEWCMSSTHDREYKDPAVARYVVNLRLNIDGRGHLFCGRAGERLNPRASAPDEHGRLILFESIVAGNFASFLATMGALYRAAGYHGHVDIGLMATSLRAAYSGTLLKQQFVFFEEHDAYQADSYPRHQRVTAAELDRPEDVARPLLRHLFEATTGREDFDPFS